MTIETTLFSRLATLGCECTLLRTQYRCHPDISSIANTLFYNGNLRDGISAADRTAVLPDMPPVAVFDVPHGFEECSASGSWYNTTEVWWALLSSRAWGGWFNACALCVIVTGEGRDQIGH